MTELQKLKFSQKNGIRSNMVLEVLIFLSLARASWEEEETSLVIFL